MKQPPTDLPSQTHFIGVPVSGDLARFLAACRSWMGERFGCKSGFATPFHVTLVPPFRLVDDESIQAMAGALEAYASGAGPFASRVSGFGSFGERTVFARVIPDARWDSLRDGLYAELSRALPGALRKDARPFTPHATIANRDIPPGAVARALEYLDGLGLEDDLGVDSLALYERRGGAWEVAARLPFGPGVR